MKAIVTGGAGFIGSNLVKFLIKNRYDVVVLDNFSTGKKENLSEVLLSPQLKIENIDITKKSDFYDIASKYFLGADCLFHLAALPRVEPSIKNPLLYNEVNVNGTLNVLTACQTFFVTKVVYSSSSAVYGDAKNKPTNEEEILNPMSPYALQKLIGDQYSKMFCDLYDMNIVSLRYFNVYGENSPNEGAYVPVIGIWERQLANNEPLTITGDGEQTRDFINVLDVAKANVMCAEASLKGHHIFNVGSGKSYSMNNIATMMSDNITYISPRIEPKETLADISKIHNIVGWEPKVNLKDYIISDIHKEEILL